MSTMTIINGNNNDKDNVRAIMVKGETGATITSITKTGTNVLTDTYTITLSDGRTQTFEVTNGKGITSIAKTDTQGLVDTYTITFNDNTTQTFTVTNGVDGISPTATVSKTNAVTTVTITDKNGTTTAQINDAVGYEVPANSVIGWDSNDAIPAGYEETTETFGGGGETLKVGTILEYSGSTAPTNYMICDGSAISRTEYSQLFAVIGTTYGAGDGSTTFNIPNFKGKVAVGYDSTQTEFDTLGETGGAKTHTLSVEEIPSHDHTISHVAVGSNAPGYTAWEENIAGGSGNTFKASAKTNATGGGQAHNNLQPYTVINYIIKVSQTTPTSAQIVDGYSTSTEDGYSANYINALNSYSTTEQRIGTWIDGKPIYRKVYTINLSASDRSTTVAIPNSIISNVKEITAINGMINGTYGFFPIYYANPNGSVADGIGIYYGLSIGLRINMGAITLDSNSSARVTIEYTKTTD